MEKSFEFKVAENENRQRLDDFLSDRIGAVSRMHLRRLLNDEKCFVNGIAQPPGYKLKTGDQVKIEVDVSTVTAMTPEDIPLEIPYEDESLLIVNKPAGMLVHPTLGVKSGTLVNALSFHLNRNYELDAATDSTLFIRPGLTHRLDKQTSGLMLIAKTRVAHRIVSNHFQRKLIEKKYYALVEGVIKEDANEINAPIGYDETSKLWRVSSDGKPSVTRFRVVERRGDSTLLELEPVTGRTNQLRIHTAYIGHPIIGDVARDGREFSRLCLHAAKIKFRHPQDNRHMEFESDLPAEMR